MKPGTIQEYTRPVRHVLLCGCMMVAWLVLCLSSGKVAAQHPHPSFRHYTVEDDLASSEVYQVKQDSRGYIWFATSNGVSRFDGYTFENFSQSDGLPDNTIFEIFEDKKGRVWFVSVSSRLSYYESGKIHGYRYNNEILKIARNQIKTSFYVDDNENIYLGMYTVGMYKILPDGTITGYDTNTVSGKLGSIVEPDSGRMIFSAFTKIKGRGYFNFYTKHQKGKLYIEENLNPLVKAGRVIRLRNGKILLSYHNILFSVDTDLNYSKYKFPAQITWLYQDRGGHIWVGTYMSGVYFVQNENYAGAKNYLTGKSVDGVLQDAEGGFWFATEGDGVFYTPSHQVLTYDQATGLPGNKVNCLATDGKNIFAGMDDGSIVRITPDGKTTSVMPRTAPHINEISALFYDSIKKELWFSGRTYQGVISPDFRNIRFHVGVFYQGLVFDDQYYFATGRHVQQYIKSRNRIAAIREEEPKDVGRIYDLLPYKNRSLLLGTQWGLWKYTLTDTSYMYMGGRDTLLQQRISCLAYLPDSSIAIATNGVGLLVYTNGQVKQISSRDGLGSDKINKIYVDGYTIWVATNQGVNKVEIRSMQPFVYEIHTYTKRNGLASNEIRDILVFQGKVWLASDKGITFFDRSLYAGSGRKDIPVYITQIAVNEKETGIEDSYALPYYENNLRFHITAPGFIDAGKQQYRYKMEGLDTTWIYTSNREIRYTTLPAGTYTFWVEVQNSDGSWSKITASATFQIIAPFWQKWWFIALYILAGVLLIGWLVRSRLKYIQSRKEKTNRMNRNLLDLKLKALRAQMNPHFTFNVMNSIQHFILHKEDEAAQRYLAKFSRLIRIILNNSEKTIIPVSEEIKALELYLELEVMRFEGKLGYTITIDPSVDIHRVTIPSMLIQPYVENAVIHGVAPLHTPGHIMIYIERSGDFIRAMVEDNGVGRQKAAQKKKEDGYRSMGMTITRERLEIINQLYGNKMSEKITDLYDDEGNPAGTRVEIFVPYIEKTGK